MRDTRVLSSSSLRNTASSLPPKRVVNTFDMTVTAASMTAVRIENEAETLAVLVSLLSFAVGIGVCLRFEVALDPEARGIGSDRE